MQHRTHISPTSENPLARFDESVMRNITDFAVGKLLLNMPHMMRTPSAIQYEDEKPKRTSEMDENTRPVWRIRL